MGILKCKVPGQKILKNNATLYMMSKNVQVNLSKWSIGTKLDPTLEVALAQRLNYVFQLKLYLGLDSFLWEAISKHLLYLCSYHTLVNRYILYLLSVKHQKKKNNNNANSWEEGCSWGIGSWLKICYIYNFVNVFCIEVRNPPCFKLSANQVDHTVGMFQNFGHRINIF